ncbi:hypothetical protein D3C81_2287070 [compost metagenome]
MEGHRVRAALHRGRAIAVLDHGVVAAAAPFGQLDDILGTQRTDDDVVAAAGLEHDAVCRKQRGDIHRVVA